MARPIRLPLRAAALLLALGAPAAGCGGKHDGHGARARADTTYVVGAVYLGPRFDSTAARVAHDDIPGVMPAMTMDLRVADRSVLRGHTEGDSVALLLEQRGTDLVIGEMRRPSDRGLR
ncbi:MAG: copper-binding protein [Rubricoccaceae bacterium]